MQFSSDYSRIHYNKNNGNNYKSLFTQGTKYNKSRRKFDLLKEPNIKS